MEEERKAFVKELEEWRDKKDILTFYDKWAHRYDVALNMYKVNTEITSMFTKHTPDRNASVLDVCCGTGLTGMFLASEGYTHIDGVDGSQGMLEQADGKSVYQSLKKCVIDEVSGIPCADSSYDSLMCSGAITRDQLLVHNAMREFVKVVKPGGVIVFTYREGDDDALLMDTISEYMKAGTIKLEELRRNFYCIIKSGKAYAYYVCLRRK